MSEAEELRSQLTLRRTWTVGRRVAHIWRTCLSCQASICKPVVTCRWCSGLNTVGIFLTFLFVPEPLRVPLAELDRRYTYTSAGKVYHGAFLALKLVMVGVHCDVPLTSETDVTLSVRVYGVGCVSRLHCACNCSASASARCHLSH